jgi:hypothetical protein
VNESARGAASAKPTKPATGWTFAAFREWKAREHPDAAYQVAPRVWTPDGIGRAAGKAERERRMIKNWEPRLAGMAYCDREVFLVVVESELSAEHAGRLLYLADLWRRDPDYLQHRSKRVHLVMLVRKADRALLEFARRRRIRVLVLGAGNGRERVSEADD